jgi:NADH:ubiquinone oxidoreductase subunit D
MRQSLNIIYQCIKLIPKGLYNVNNHKLVVPNRSQTKFFMETLINHFKLYSIGFTIKTNETYVSVEAPKGEFGIYLISNNTNKPYRCKIRAPGFTHLQSLDFMAKNHLIADVVAIIGTHDIVFGEVDR